MHRDVKVANFLWSSSKNKYVLIDYGLSKVIQEEENQKSYVGFAGSYNYCSPEIKKLYFIKERNWVNLYESDYYAMSVLLQEL